jgi:hypothetical protein
MALGIRHAVHAAPLLFAKVGTNFAVKRCRPCPCVPGSILYCQSTSVLPNRPAAHGEVTFPIASSFLTFLSSLSLSPPLLHSTLNAIRNSHSSCIFSHSLCLVKWPFRGPLFPPCLAYFHLSRTGVARANRDPEDGGDKFLRNASELLQRKIILQSGRQSSRPHSWRPSNPNFNQ